MNFPENRIQTIRWLIIAISFLASGWISYLIYFRSIDEKLWGWLPFWLYVAVITCIIALWKGTPYKINARGKLLLASISSGILLGFGFMNPYLIWMSFIGFIPLLYIDHKIDSKDYNYNKNRLTFHYTYISFLIWNVIANWWVTNTHFMSGFLAIVLNAFLMALPFMAFRWTRRKFGDRLGYFSFIVFFIAFEYGHHRWELGYPWITLGNGLGATPSLIQWYEFTGVFGGSLWILLVNTLIWLAFHKSENIPSKNAFFKPALALLAPIVVSLLMYQFQDIEKGDTLRIGVTQPNLEPHYEKYYKTHNQEFQHYINLGKEALKDSLDLLVYPETSMGGLWYRKNPSRLLRNDRVGKLQRFSKHYDTDLVVGITGYRQFADYEEDTPYIRYRHNKRYEAHNAAMMVYGNKDTIPYYIKSKLVPGAETIPFKEVLSPIQHIVSNLGGVNGTLGKQDTRTVFTDAKKGIVLAPIICWESEFGEFITDFTKAGAQIFLTITNDGWWDDTPGHKQHFAMSQIRAIENRRWIARSANMGNTGFINEKGIAVGDISSYGNEGHRTYDVPAIDYITPFVKHGDMIGRFAGILSLFLLSVLIVVSVKGKKG